MRTEHLTCCTPPALQASVRLLHGENTCSCLITSEMCSENHFDTFASWLPKMWFLSSSQKTLKAKVCFCEKLFWHLRSKVLRHRAKKAKDKQKCTHQSCIPYTIYNFKHNKYTATLSAHCTFFFHPYFMGIYTLIPWNQTAAGKLGRQTKEEPGVSVCVRAQTALFFCNRGGRADEKSE